MKKKVLYQIRLKSVKKLNLTLYIHYLKNILAHIKQQHEKDEIFSYSFSQLPTTRKLITVLKSPHVYKKAQESFEFKKYSALLTVSINFQMVKNFLKILLLNKPLNVFLSVRQKCVTLDKKYLKPIPSTNLSYVCESALLATEEDKKKFKKFLSCYVL